MATDFLKPSFDDHSYDDNPEHYEFIDGQAIRKASVGHRKHSMLERIIFSLLVPFQEKLGGHLVLEWTIRYGKEKLIPDVTLSFPNYLEDDGYLVPPAFLVVETGSKDQRTSYLLRKCRQKYHPSGTPYCWVIDSEEEAGYECHKEMNGLFREAEVLTAGPEISIPVATIFETLKTELAKTSSPGQ